MTHNVFLSTSATNSPTANLIVESNRAFMWTLCFLATEGCSWLVLEAYCQNEYKIPSFSSTMPKPNEKSFLENFWSFKNCSVQSQFESISFCFKFNAIQKASFHDRIDFTIQSHNKFVVMQCAMFCIVSQLHCHTISPIQIPFLREKLKNLWISELSKRRQIEITKPFLI